VVLRRPNISETFGAFVSAPREAVVAMTAKPLEFVWLSAEKDAYTQTMAMVISFAIMVFIFQMVLNVA